MFDLNTIKAGKNKPGQSKISLSSDPEMFLKEGLTLFDEFSETHSEEILKKALNNFFSYIERNKSKADPFFYIAFSAYLLNEREIAEKYLRYTVEISPEFPNINQLKTLITKM